MTRWDDYFDRLDADLTRFDVELAAGHAPELALPAEPDEPLPPRLRHRGQAVVRLLTEITERSRVRRDELAADLAAMPPRRPRRDPARVFDTSLGSSLDIVG